MRNELILWADDEIDLLKPHILFLKQKGYEVITVSNGRDALEMSEKEHFDLIILDENMPGLSGLETLSRIKETNPDVPVVMITKNEEENIMTQAIGNKIADYCYLSKRIFIKKKSSRKKPLPGISKNLIKSVPKSTIHSHGKTGTRYIKN